MVAPCINLGLYLCQHYQSQIEIGLGSQSGHRRLVRLRTDQLHLKAALDMLTPPRTPALQPVRATILSVDFERGIICTSRGAIQFNDPDVGIAAFDAIGKQVIMGLDYDASPLRTMLPELCSLELDA